MNLAASLLGTTAVEQLQKTAVTPVLQVGSDRFTRYDLAGVECFNFVAARNLSEILGKELQVKNLKDVYDNIAPSALALPRLGVIALAVLGAAFEAKGLGGDAPLESWARKHAAQKNGERTWTTFATMKEHQQQREQPPPAARRRRR